MKQKREMAIGHAPQRAKGEKLSGKSQNTSKELPINSSTGLRQQTLTHRSLSV
jgi:hypothetical protein